MTTFTVSTSDLSLDDSNLYVLSGSLTPTNNTPPAIRPILESIQGRWSWKPGTRDNENGLSINDLWDFSQTFVGPFLTPANFVANRDAVSVEPDFATLVNGFNPNIPENWFRISGITEGGLSRYDATGVVTVAELVVNGRVDRGTITPPTTTSPQLREYDKQKIEESIEIAEKALGVLRAVVSISRIPIIAAFLPPQIKVALAVAGTIGSWAKSLTVVGKLLLLNDPPDPNYQVFQAPVDRPFTPLSMSDGLTQEQVNLFNDLVQNALAQASLYEATLKTFDKSAGAELAGDEFWRHQQLILADEYLDQISLLLEQENSITLRLEAFIDGIGLPDNTQVNFDQALEEILSQDYSLVPINEVAAVIAFAGDSLDSLQGQTLNVSSVFSEEREATQTLADALIEGTLKPANVYVDRNNLIVGGPQDGEVYAGALTGTFQNDFIVGTLGNDTLFGDTGNDVLIGGEGDDNYYNESGNNTVIAGSGNNIIGMGSGNDVVTAGDGSNFVYIADPAAANGGTNTITTGAGNDNIWLPSGDNTINAGVGNNLIGIGIGNDTVTTGDGDDFVYTVNGGGGTNVLNLGNGNNIIWLETGDYQIHTGIGNDSIGLGTGLDIVRDAGGNNIIYMVDSAQIAGNKDILTGSGDDYIQTGSGDDLIDGGLGLNTLFGGAGNDTFVLREGAYNFIGDFEVGSDALQLTSLSFTDLSFFQGTGSEAADAFIFVGEEAIAQIANTTINQINNVSNFV